MLGSYDWAQQNRGQMNLKEKLYLLQKTLAPTMQHLLQYLLPKQRETIFIDFNKIVLPDSTLVKAAIEQLEETQKTSLIYHSWRSYFWGIAFSQIHGWQYDNEVFLVAALLHDLGLIDPHRAPNCQCFTLNSAIQAEQLCQNHHYSQEKTDLVTDVICMHMNGFTDMSQPKEVIMLQKGTSCDVIGSELYLIDKQFQEQCLQNYPRENFNSVFKASIQEEIKRHPHSRTAFLNQLGLSTLIQLNPFNE
ncbi:hypothetical protein KTH71_13535 [Acinetobacter sp. WU_MDCI_Axc73]|nr:hypothetical protein [Acinetobacter sp. WU_MDCI_Axc73]